MPVTLLAFDLDGTLVRTEALKATSYADAAADLRPSIDRPAVEAAYADLVGYSRERITRTLLDAFHLAPEAEAQAPDAEPWRTYVALRLARYRAMLGDAALVRRSTWEHAVGLLRDARDLADRVALVTTSERWAADLVIRAMGWDAAFDTIVTADDVAAVKPDPAGYRLAMDRLGVTPERTLAVEDSPSGVRAALAAGIRPLVVPTPFTRARTHQLVEAGQLNPADILTPEALGDTARRRLAEMGARPLAHGAGGGGARRGDRPSPARR